MFNAKIDLMKIKKICLIRNTFWRRP